MMMLTQGMHFATQLRAPRLYLFMMLVCAAVKGSQSAMIQSILDARAKCDPRYGGAEEWAELIINEWGWYITNYRNTDRWNKENPSWKKMMEENRYVERGMLNSDGSLDHYDCKKHEDWQARDREFTACKIIASNPLKVGTEASQRISFVKEDIQQIKDVTYEQIISVIEENKRNISDLSKRNSGKHDSAMDLLSKQIEDLICLLKLKDGHAWWPYQSWENSPLAEIMSTVRSNRIKDVTYGKIVNAIHGKYGKTKDYRKISESKEMKLRSDPNHNSEVQDSAMDSLSKQIKDLLYLLKLKEDNDWWPDEQKECLITGVAEFDNTIRSFQEWEKRLHYLVDVRTKLWHQPWSELKDDLLKNYFHPWRVPVPKWAEIQRDFECKKYITMNKLREKEEAYFREKKRGEDAVTRANEIYRQVNNNINTPQINSTTNGSTSRKHGPERAKGFRQKLRDLWSRRSSRKRSSSLPVDLGSRSPSRKPPRSRPVSLGGKPSESSTSKKSKMSRIKSLKKWGKEFGAKFIGMLTKSKKKTKSDRTRRRLTYTDRLEERLMKMLSK